jgi:hypothetical protein
LQSLENQGIAPQSVIPVKTGIQLFFKGFSFPWIPAFAGMTNGFILTVPAALR